MTISDATVAAAQVTSEDTRPIPEDGAPDGDAPGAGRFASNAAWLLVGQATGKVASFVYVVVVTRSLGPLAYGELNFAVSFVPLFLIFATWGLDVAILRGVARHRERASELVAAGLVIRAGLGLGALVLAVAIAPALVESSRALLVLVLVGIALYLDEITTLLGSVFKAFEAMAVHSLVLVVNRVGSTALAVAVVLAGGDLLAVCATYLLGSLGALVVASAVMRRRFPPVSFRTVTRRRVVELLRQGAPLGLASAMSMALFRADAVILQVLEGPRSVGLYGIAYRFFESFLFVAWSVAVVAMPRMARAGRSPASGRSFTTTAALLLSFYLPLAVGAPFAARWVVVTVFGERYAGATAAVVWLTAAGVFYALAHLARLSSMALGERRFVAWVAGAALVVNVVANLAVIPRYGVTGAAAVTCLTEVLEAGLLVALFRRANGRLHAEGVLAVPLVAGAVLGLVLLLSGAQDATALALSLPVYALALAGAARFFAPAEFRRSVAAVRRRLQPAG